MSSPRQRLENDMKSALKERDRTRLATLRLLLTAVDNERIRAGSAVDEAGFLRLVQKGIKQRRDSAEQYRRGNREELAQQEEAEAEILASYLPPPIDDHELRHAVELFVAEESLSGPAALGRVMKEMLSRYSGRADGAAIQAIAREVLSQSTE